MRYRQRPTLSRNVLRAAHSAPAQVVSDLRRSAKKTMQSDDIHQFLSIEFHAVPEECWSPRFDPYEHRRDIFWREHRLSGVSEAEEAEAEWIQTSRWLELSERTRYFLRIRLENAARALASDEAPNIKEESVGIQDGGISGRKAISRIVSKLWTEDTGLDWEGESIRHESPRRVYMPHPEQKRS
jgi:hypothetical protein